MRDEDFEGVNWTFIAVALAIGLILFAAFGLGWGNVFYTRTVGVSQAEADRHLFEHGTSFVQGKETEISRLFLDHDTEKDPAVKNALRRRIIEASARVKPQLSPDLQDKITRIE